MPTMTARELHANAYRLAPARVSITDPATGEGLSMNLVTTVMPGRLGNSPRATRAETTDNRVWLHGDCLGQYRAVALDPAAEVEVSK